jgi:nucleotide-binding universal stress UspA family protein
VADAVPWAVVFDGIEFRNFGIVTPRMGRRSSGSIAAQGITQEPMPDALSCGGLHPYNRGERTRMPNTPAARFDVKTILVPTDFSDGSQAALDRATALAKAFNARIIVLHVIETFTYTMTESLQVVNVYALVKTAVEPVLDQMLQDLRDERVTASRVLVQGTADQEIVAQAKESGADLIVMGTHGRRGVSHAFMGSVAERVVRTAPCPVLTVRTPAK